ncbi:uncharacterized protein LOC105423382 [Pogonomyrmex barbatus]|uniref:Uncharacterized protein LOC105423382 n=1 Tax=Pogonomyrmex barbatus TaxID=144034 RepID=A0A6I9VTY9_9HYME|nr:uncharacterized protein LOC105423382 [Pogonomyrmex barbatus]XP_025073160.1 uncharacterized protein LOC105423382 [Pogonomyrmex barbatus]
MNQSNVREKKMEHLELVERELLEQCSQVATLVEYFAWLQRCDECIKQLEELGPSRVQCPRVTVGSRQSVVARVERLASAKIQLKKRFVYADGEYASTSRDNSSFVWRDIDTAFESRVLTGAVDCVNLDHIEPRRFLEDAGGTVLERVRDAVKKHGSVKVNTAFNGEFVTGAKRANKSINTENIELFRVSNVHEWYERQVVEPTLASLEEEARDGGWALSRILNLTLNVNKYIPSHARCNFEVPREIMLKRAVINVRSMDNACFAWSVVAALHPTEGHTDRESSYPHYTSVLNLQDITFPVTLNQIKNLNI